MKHFEMAIFPLISSFTFKYLKEKLIKHLCNLLKIYKKLVYKISSIHYYLLYQDRYVLQTYGELKTLKPLNLSNKALQNCFNIYK